MTDPAATTSRDAPASPWERQHHDTNKSWRAFLLYRDAGPTRRMIDVARQLSVSIQLISRWGRDHDWGNRVWAFDMESDRAWRRRVEAERSKVAERHVGLLRLAQSKALERLRELDPASLSAGDVLRYLAETLRMEQAIFGLAEDQQVGGLTVILDPRLVSPPTMTPAALNGAATAALSATNGHAHVDADTG